MTTVPMGRLRRPPGRSADDRSFLPHTQLLLTTRPDAGAGSFDITFNCGHVTWETGDASGGVGGIGGTAARAGYTDGSGPAGTWYELPGSGQVAALVDGGTSALVSGSQGSPIPGRYVFQIRG